MDLMNLSLIYSFSMNPFELMSQCTEPDFHQAAVAMLHFRSDIVTENDSSCDGKGY